MAGACLAAAPAVAATVTRGPYLQQGTPTSVIVRWRTDVPTDSEVRYGLAPGSLGYSVSSAASTTEHQLALTGLVPNTKYSYSVGTTSTTLAGGNSYFFVTPVQVGTPRPTRIWAIGDSGTANANQRAVRDAYAAHTGSAYTHVWLMLGDNAYQSGTDIEYQNAVFDIYDAVTPQSLPARFLRQTVLWPTLGNHDTASSTNPPATLPYYQMFTLPTNGESGGLASGTEDYYSFDHANIHFVCLDSMTESRSPSGPMLTWLAADLASTTQDWIIAYWHHPPYSHGTHDSDNETALREMRQNALPILESHGVDLVLTGHSHDYERSFLLDGHYGDSSTFDPATMVKDGGDGRSDGTGAYQKPSGGLAPNEGAVYVVNGNSGAVCSSCGALDHPAMYVAFGQEAGSMVIDVDGNRLDARYLRRDGVTRDYFTILKGVPTASIDDVSITEGDSGTRHALFTVSLSAPADGIASVGYAAAHGTATAGSDYTAVSGTLRFPSGVTTRTIAVPIKGDLVTEGDETFFVDLGSSSNAVVGDGQGQGTIVDDDRVGAFGFGAATYSVSEAAAAATVTVRRSGKAEGGAVDYASSDGSATVVSDYTGSSGTLTFGPGVTSRTLTVPIVRDAVHEASETLLLRLSDATGPGSALEAQHTAVVTILDNDPAPLLQFGAPRYAVKEGSGAATLTVRRVGSRANEATVDYATKDGTAQAGADFAQATGTLTFGTDVVTQTLAIPIVDDPNPEASETLDVTLGNPQPGSGATLGNLTATRVTITDNDQGLQFSAASYMAAESAPRAVIAVRRSGGTTGTLTVDYAVTGGTATGGSDYSLAPGTLSFGPGQALRTFAVTILNDADAEGSETVELALSGYSPPTAQGALGTAVLTITDTEPVFQFSAGTYPVPEKAPRAVITVRRTGPTTGDAKVDYTVSDGTAQAAIDYTSASTGTLSFGAGRATQTLSIGVIDDAEDEPSETLQLVLQNPSAGCGIGTPGSALLTISDNDVAGRAQFSAGAFSQAEDGGSVTITVTRATGTSGMATVHYVATPGAVNPGVPGTDYQPAAGTLTFGPGDTSQSFEVVVLDDVVADGARSVALTLSEPGGGLVLGARSAAVLWLVDDE